MLDKYIEEIEVNKELLASFPRNNIKNQKKVLEKYEELLNKYQNDTTLILKEMERRYNEYIISSKNLQIDELLKEQERIFNQLYLIETKTPYEKSGLSKHLYKLERFYDNDLEGVNQTIKEVLEIFDSVGLKLSILDFSYSTYTKTYMKEVFNNSSIEDLKICFEDIYFKSPTLFKQISLNFKLLYYKNKKMFTNYYDYFEQNFLNNRTKDEVYKEFLKLDSRIKSEIIQDKDTNLNKFLNGQMQVKDHMPDQVANNYKLFTADIITEENILEVNDTILKFLDSLEEYKGYLKYSYIFQEMKKLYGEKDKYKNVSVAKFKELNKKQANLFKINKKIDRLLSRNSDRYKSKIEILLNSVETLILELDVLYKEYEENLFLESISLLSTNVYLFDILKLSVSNYNFIVNLIKKTNEDMSIDDINLEIENLEKYLRITKFTILNHINVTDNKEIDSIIIDKYNLLGLNLKKEQITFENIDTLMNIGYLLLNNYYVLKQFNLSNISFILEYEKMKNDL